MLTVYQVTNLNPSRNFLVNVLCSYTTADERKWRVCIVLETMSGHYMSVDLPEGLTMILGGIFSPIYSEWVFSSLNVVYEETRKFERHAYPSQSLISPFQISSLCFPIRHSPSSGGINFYHVLETSQTSSFGSRYA